MHAHDNDPAMLAAPAAARRRTEVTHQGRQGPAEAGSAVGNLSVLGTAGMLRLQRQAGNEAVSRLVEEERSPVLDVVGSGGSPMESGLRRDMETRLGADFSDVRLHTDAQAHDSARAVGARAYTVGRDVVFQRDAFDPGSHAGRTTLAHELTHVVQQRSGPVSGTDTGTGVSISDPGDSFERAAVANAEAVMAEPAVQREPEGVEGGVEEDELETEEG